ncbi:hypothetical protein [Ferrovibrio sp.]|uniref:hypothetical protein n=1 Tax=Ferrovibrio sp. TaxID=1917215 RepID=UPI003D0CA5C9
MVEISTHKDLQPLQKLPFCFYCGLGFKPEDQKDQDHVPAETIFAKSDRRPLKLPTHIVCNAQHAASDQLVGQLIQLLRFEVPKSERDRQLQFYLDTANGLGAVTNINLDAMAQRWLRGFHAALYRQPLAENTRFAITFPMPKARLVDGQPQFEPLRIQQHQFVVDTIKNARPRRNLDRIEINNGKLVYECVWVKADNADYWSCFFALDVCGWRDLAPAYGFPRCGCAGLYTVPAGELPKTAMQLNPGKIRVQNLDPLDPFGP